MVTRVWKIEYSSSSIPIYGEKVAYREGSLVGYHFFLLYWQNDGWVRGTCDFRFYCNTYCQISIPSKCARLFNYSQPSLITVKYISLPNSIIVLINPNIFLVSPKFHLRKQTCIRKKEKLLNHVSRVLVTVLIAQLNPTSFYSLSSMLSTSNCTKHVFSSSIASTMLLSFCFLAWMNEWTWLRGCIVKADLCCCQSKLLSSAAKIILTCPLFRVQKNTVCSIVQPQSGYRFPVQSLFFSLCIKLSNDNGWLYCRGF